MLFHSRDAKGLRIAADGDDKLIIRHFNLLTGVGRVVARHLLARVVVVEVLFAVLDVEVRPMSHGRFHRDGLLGEVDVVGPSLHKLHVRGPSRANGFEGGAEFEGAHARAVQERREDEIGARRYHQSLVPR